MMNSLSIKIYIMKSIFEEQSKNEIFALTEEQSKEIERLKFKLYQQLELIKNENEKYQNTTIEIPDLKDFNLSKKEQWNDFKQLFDITFPDFEIKYLSYRLNMMIELSWLYLLKQKNILFPLTCYIKPAQSY